MIFERKDRMHMREMINGILIVGAVIFLQDTTC